MVMSRRRVMIGGAAVGAGALSTPFVFRKSVPTLRIAGSIYIGWMPWYLAAEDGTLEDVAKKYGIKIEFIRGDYADTIGLFAGGTVDAVVMTNIDAISSIAAAGFSADVILVGSFSNGNDAILASASNDGSLETNTFGLVEFSVSHYLLDRIAEKEGFDPQELKTRNIADSAMIASYLDNTNGIDAVVTWNPIVQNLTDQYNAKIVADSTTIPREIADMLVVNREIAAANPNFAPALLEVWFNVVNRLSENRSATAEKMGQLFGSNGADFLKQLEKTILISDPITAQEAFNDPSIAIAAQKAQEFALRRGIVQESPRNWVGNEEVDDSLLKFNKSYLAAYGS